VLVATGSEVSLALEAREALEVQGVKARVVSMPSWEIFLQQSQDYRDEVFPAGIPVLAVEAGVSLGWKTYIGAGASVIGVDRFGASAPGGRVMAEYGFNVESVVKRAVDLLGTKK